MNILDILYFDGKLSEVVKSLATFPTAYNLSKKELYVKVLEDLKNGVAADINGDLFEAYENNLRKAVDGVFKGGEEYSDITLQLQANVSRFAAYKAYQATKELNGIEADEIDSRGKAILNKYNRWQAAEYNTAMSRARTARQYHDFTSDPISNELYPNLKWLPSRSATPREAHRLFWNLVWAKNDPFWNENTPGSLWNCKCDWEETDEPVTNGNPVGNVSAKGLYGNPAKTGEIFYSLPPDKSEEDHRHPYFRNISNTKRKKMERYVGDKLLRKESIQTLKAIQNDTVTVDKRGEDINVLFDYKTTKHLANDVAESCNFLWNVSMPHIKKLLKEGTLVAHEPNMKQSQKPSALHYYYYKCTIGREEFYLNVEENYVVMEDRHFYRLYAIVDRLRETAILY